MHSETGQPEEDPTTAGDPVPDVLEMWLEPFRDAFTAPTWRFVLILVMGALLAPGKRTVTACLRITGRAMVENFASYHQVLNRARWNPRDLAKQLARLLVARLVAQGEPIVIGLDDTIERRWGARIRARGIYRDPVRSSRGHFVKTSGLRWLSFMLLTPLPLLPGIKALPVLTILAPSERWAEQQGRRHKPLTDWARQGMLQIIRWFPKRAIIFVGDSSFGTHELAHAIARHATLISRLRLDASLFAPPEPRTPGQRGRPRQKGKPRPKLQTRLDDPAARWTPITLPRWYGGVKDKTLEILSETALWYRPGTPPKAIPMGPGARPGGPAGPPGLLQHRPQTWTRPRSSPSSCAAGRSRSPSRTCAPISASRPNASGPMPRSNGQRRCCWECTAWSACGRAKSSPKHRIPIGPPWYWKSSFTFSDAIAAVRAQLWLDCILQRSASDRKRQKIMPFNPDHYDGDRSFPEYTVKNVPPDRIQRMVEGPVLRRIIVQSRAKVSSRKSRRDVKTYTLTYRSWHF